MHTLSLYNEVRYILQELNLNLQVHYLWHRYVTIQDGEKTVLVLYDAEWGNSTTLHIFKTDERRASLPAFLLRVPHGFYT